MDWKTDLVRVKNALMMVILCVLAVGVMLLIIALQQLPQILADATAAKITPDLTPISTTLYGGSILLIIGFGLILSFLIFARERVRNTAVEVTTCPDRIKARVTKMEKGKEEDRTLLVWKVRYLPPLKKGDNARLNALKTLLLDRQMEIESNAMRSVALAPVPQEKQLLEKLMVNVSISAFEAFLNKVSGFEDRGMFLLTLHPDYPFRFMFQPNVPYWYVAIICPPDRMTKHTNHTNHTNHSGKITEQVQSDGQILQLESQGTGEQSQDQSHEQLQENKDANVETEITLWDLAVQRYGEKSAPLAMWNLIMGDPVTHYARDIIYGWNIPCQAHSAWFIQYPDAQPDILTFNLKESNASLIPKADKNLEQLKKNRLIARKNVLECVISATPKMRDDIQTQKIECETKIAEYRQQFDATLEEIRYWGVSKWRGVRFFYNWKLARHQAKLEKSIENLQSFSSFLTENVTEIASKKQTKKNLKLREKWNEQKTVCDTKISEYQTELNSIKGQIQQFGVRNASKIRVFRGIRLVWRRKSLQKSLNNLQSFLAFTEAKLAKIDAEEETRKAAIKELGEAEQKLDQATSSSKPDIAVLDMMVNSGECEAEATAALSAEQIYNEMSELFKRGWNSEMHEDQSLRQEVQSQKIINKKLRKSMNIEIIRAVNEARDKGDIEGLISAEKKKWITIGIVALLFAVAGWILFIARILPLGG